MTKLEKMPQITDQVLHGLVADEGLKHRIVQKAASLPAEEERRNSSFRLAPVLLCSLVAVMILAVFLLNGLQSTELEPIHSFPAGSVTTEEAVETASP